MSILGVCRLELLEKLLVILSFSRGNRSLYKPSKMCISIRRELVAVLDCLRK